MRLLSVLLLLPFVPASATPVDTAPPAVQAAWQPAQDMGIRELAKGVYIVDHAFPWPSNSLVVFGSDGSCLLLDTPYTVDATKLLLGWIEERSGGTLPPTTAIVTHFHIDRLGGIPALLERGIPVHGSDMTVRLLAERGLGNGMVDMLGGPGQERFKEAFENAELLPPDHVFPIGEGLQLELDGEPVEVRYPGGGHTEDNVVVWLPARRLLYAACLVKCQGAGPGFLGDADLPHWADSLRKLRERYPDAINVVPGHGPSGGIDLIDYTIQVVETRSKAKG